MVQISAFFVRFLFSTTKKRTCRFIFSNFRNNVPFPLSREQRLDTDSSLLHICFHQLLHKWTTRDWNDRFAFAIETERLLTVQWMCIFLSLKREFTSLKIKTKLSSFVKLKHLKRKTSNKGFSKHWYASQPVKLS